MKSLSCLNAYPSRRLPVFGRNGVATSHPLAAQAGLQMLRQGGSAVDAAVAAAAVMTVVEPCSNGLGSDAFALVWDGGQLQGLNASGRAPLAWTPAYFSQRYGSAARRPPARGWDSVTVPGAVSAWVALWERHGRLPFQDLMAPAAEVAERGFAVPVVVQHKWAAAAAQPELTSQPGFAQAFLPRGRAPEVGERFCLPGAARTLRAIGASRGEAFYRGEIAQALVQAARGAGGALGLEDLSAHRADWVEPIGLDLLGHRVHELPPNGQGIAALIALGLLRESGRLDELHSLPADDASAQHLQIEAMKLAFADLYTHLADPAAMRVGVADLLDAGYLRERARLISPDRAGDFGPGLVGRGGTIYLCAADERGQMVSFIQSNYMGFGSGVVLPEWGLSLQNRGHGFSLDPASPNVVAPGKRPFHTIIPGFLTRGDEAQMAFGVMGAHMQPQGHLQALLRMLVHGQDPQSACDAPRWRWNPDGSLNLESHWPAATVQALQQLGHRLDVIRDPYQDFGAGQFIWRLGDPAVEGYVAASDPRRDGLVAVW
jgi:gamma-glutamyltranspeptidase/glutathione hydrolase